MLFPSLYQIQSITNVETNKFEAQIILDAKHEIFNGHFPNNPVMPGVCMMQIIKEITEQIIGCQVRLIESNNIKFMALINPVVTPNLRLEFEIVAIENEIKVKNVTYFNDTVALKLSSLYSKN